MKIQRAYKTKLLVNNKEKTKLEACASAARFVYNWALADRKSMFESGGKPNKFEQKKRFNATKDDFCSWIRDYPATIAQEEFDNVDRAYQNFFKRRKDGVGYPKFKSRFTSQKKFTLRGTVKIESDKVKLPGLGWMRLSESGYLPQQDAKINFVSISEKAGEWYISLQVEIEIAEPEPAVNQPIGVDVGIKSLAVISDGKVFDNPKTLKKYTARMAKLSRELSRREKGGSNRQKTKDKIAKLHRKIANTRSNTLHEISSYTTKLKPSTIVLEDLNVKGMMSNGKLSKAMADASVSELSRQITYKAAWNGINVVKADRWYPSSKTCNHCGHVNKELTLSDRVWTCKNCNSVIDRDLNAALNLASLA